MRSPTPIRVTVRCAAVPDDNEVLNTLGPNGSPQSSSGDSGTMPSIQDVYRWRTDLVEPSLNSHVTETGTGSVTLPIDHTGEFLPPNGTGTNDSAGGLTAVYSGTIDVPTTEKISFSIGADDSAFAYLDGQVVCDLGRRACTLPTACAPRRSTLPPAPTVSSLLYDDMDP